jgi:ankyrin repeat domain-containing protein 50
VPPTREQSRSSLPHRSSPIPIPAMDTTQCDSPNTSGADFTNDGYTVGWICALKDELAASQAMLDEEHRDLPCADNDSNAYTLGRIGEHNVVLACLPAGTTGTNAAAMVAINLLRSFPKIRFGLMVGVGGGAPGQPSDDSSEDLRLGDVAVSKPEGEHGKEVFYLVGNIQINGIYRRRRTI